MANQPKPKPIEHESKGDGSPSKLEKASGELGSDQVQKAVEDETAKGYRGVKVDPEPNESYTAAGQFKK